MTPIKMMITAPVWITRRLPTPVMPMAPTFSAAGRGAGGVVVCKALETNLFCTQGRPPRRHWLCVTGQSATAPRTPGRQSQTSISARHASQRRPRHEPGAGLSILQPTIVLPQHTPSKLCYTHPPAHAATHRRRRRSRWWCPAGRRCSSTGPQRPQRARSHPWAAAGRRPAERWQNSRPTAGCSAGVVGWLVGWVG